MLSRVRVVCLVYFLKDILFISIRFSLPCRRPNSQYKYVIKGLDGGELLRRRERISNRRMEHCWDF